MSRQHYADVDLPKDVRSATGTYRRGAEVVSLTAWTIAECHAKAHKLLGDEAECLSISTPRTIFNDLTGETARRAGTKGMWATSEQEAMPSERPSAG